MSDAFPMVAACAERQGYLSLMTVCAAGCGEPVTYSTKLCATCALRAELQWGERWRARA